MLAVGRVVKIQVEQMAKKISRKRLHGALKMTEFLALIDQRRRISVGYLVRQCQ